MTYAQQPVNAGGQMLFTITRGAAGWSVAPSVEHDSVAFHLGGSVVLQRNGTEGPNALSEQDRSMLMSSDLDSLLIYTKGKRIVMSTARAPSVLRGSMRCLAEHRGPAIAVETEAEVASAGALIAQGARERTAGRVIELLAVGAAIALASGNNSNGDLPALVAVGGLVVGVALEIGGNSKQARGGEILKARGF